MQQQVLPGVIARHAAGRRAQAQAKDIAADIDAVDQLAAELALRQLAGGEHAVPVQHAVLLRLRQAGKHLPLLERLAGLAHAPVDQQRRADLAIAVAAALRALEALAPRRIEDALALLDLKYQAGGL